MHLHPLAEEVEEVKGQPNVLSISMKVEDQLVAALLVWQEETGDMLDQLLLGLGLDSHYLGYVA
jgi:hypothetical protein